MLISILRAITKKNKMYYKRKIFGGKMVNRKYLFNIK